MNNYEFISFDDIIKDTETKIINFLYDYKLLSSFSLDTKKVILYFLIKEFNDKLHNRKLLIYHTHSISTNHELLEYFDKTKLDNFINKLTSTLKKITKRLFFIKDNNIPKKGNIHLLDGEIVDEIILLNNEEPDLKELKQFLHKHNLRDIFTSLHS